MSSRWLDVCLAMATALAVQSAAAQPVNGCPAGQAMQSSDPGGKNITCVALPPPVDLAPLQAQINNEAATRAGMDATLLSAIQDLRSDAIEASIVGRYAFSGTQACITSTFGFNDDLTPKASTDPTRAAVVTQFTAVTTGFRTFNSDGTGTAEFHTQSISYPGPFYTSSGFSGFTNGGAPSRPGGSANVAEQTGTFAWQVVDGKLIIEATSDPTGPFLRGPNANCTIRSEGAPRAVGILGKDLKTITITHEDVKVETGITTCPDGRVFTSPRICHRERLLRKM
jgi:hypothetical protein